MQKRNGITVALGVAGLALLVYAAAGHAQTIQSPTFWVQREVTLGTDTRNRFYLDLTQVKMPNGIVCLVASNSEHVSIACPHN
jgi:hypothetical protein